MTRVRASDVIVLLYAEAAAREEKGQSGDFLRITTTTLRSWVHRGHITRGAGGYDLAEILAYIERRVTVADSTTTDPGRLP